MATVPMLSPEGLAGDIPQERVTDAVNAGFRMGAELTSPDGKVGIVPMERVHDAIKAGFTLRGAAPSAPAQQQMQQVDITGKPQNPSAAMAGVPGGAPNVQPASPTAQKIAAAGIGAGAAATYGPVALPFLGRVGMQALRAVPYMAAAEGINYARQNLPLGKYIPQSAELLPWLMMGGHGEPGKKPPAAEPVYPGAPFPETPPPEALNPALGSKNRTLPGQISPEVTRPPRPTPAEPIPARFGLALPPGPEPEPVYPGAPEPSVPASVRQAVGLRTGGQAAQDPSEALGQLPRPKLPFLPRSPEPAPRVTQKAVQSQIERGLGNETPAIKPGVPIRNQRLPEGHTPAESSAVSSFRYDPEAQELHVNAKSGNTTYIHGDVSPEDAQAFAEAPSKGKAWQQIRQNSPLVGKIVNGQRVATKPPVAAQSAEPEGNNLTNLLTSSVKQAQEKPPQFAYRARPVGEQGVPSGSHAQATSSYAQAAKYAEPGQQQPGAPGEVVRVDLSKLSPKDYVIKSHPSGAKWVQFTRPLAENEVEPVSQAAGQAKNVRPVQGKQ